MTDLNYDYSQDDGMPEDIKAMHRREQEAIKVDPEEAMAEEIDRLRSIIAEVHSWIVCAAISTPADMAKNFPRITEITHPEYPGV